MSNLPYLAQSNVNTLIAQIAGMEPDDYLNRSLDFVAGFIMAKSMSVRAVERMWGAAEIVALTDLDGSPVAPVARLSDEELTEVAHTLKLIAHTITGAR